MTRQAFLRRLLPVALILMGAIWIIRPYRFFTAAVSAPHPSEFLKQYTELEALEIWRAMHPPGETVRIEADELSDTFAILVDVNDDGVIDAKDQDARARGMCEIVRLDDTIANGRSRVYDRSPLLDDDLQLLTLALPASCDDSDELVIAPETLASKNVAFYTSDVVSAESEFKGRIRLGELPFHDGPAQRAHLWMKATGKPDSRESTLPIEISLVRGDTVVASDTLGVLVVGPLGDSNYFAAALDYVMERDRITAAPAKLFLDEAKCPSAEKDGTYETFQLVIMRHALAEMNVLETYYANHSLTTGRIDSIFDAIDRNPAEDVVINGNFFYLENGVVNHGKRALGALVHDHELSEASGWHTWQVSYEEAGIYTKPDWQFKSYCLTQRDHAPGEIELVEEPLDLANPFVPPIPAGSPYQYPYMAMGGLHQVHNFTYNPGYAKACMGIVEPAARTGEAPDGDRRLIWLAATLSDPFKTTSRDGGAALRQKLRDSGLTIDEGDPANGIPPGRCDMVYFDSANSVALAYKIDGVVETPTAGGRHRPGANNTLVNNYLMLSVADAP